MIPGARSLRRRGLLAVLLLALPVLACREPPRPLDVGTTERVIAPGERHRYAIELSRTQALALELDQRGLDLVLGVEGPGADLLTMDNPRTLHRPETLTWIARLPGRAIVTIEAPDAGTRPGSYRLRAAHPRPASRQDFAANRGYRRYQAGQAERRSGRFREARRSFERAARELEEAGDGRAEAWAWHKVGGVSAGDLDEPERAEGPFRRALLLERRAGGGRALSSALNSLGSVLVGTRERAAYFEAVVLFQEAREILADLGMEDPRHEVRLLVGEAAAQHWIGRTQTALDLNHRALDLARATGDAEGECRAQLGIARTLQRIGDHERALEACDACLEVAPTDEWRATILGEMATLSVDLERPKEALDYLARADAADRSRKTRGRRLHDRGRALGRLERFREAERSFAEALEIQDRRAEQDAILLDRAYVRARAGEYEESRDLCFGVLERGVEGSDPLAVAGAHHCLARAYRALGRREDALRHIQLAVGRVEDLRGRVAQDRLRSIFLVSKREYYELYVSLLLEMADQERSEGASARLQERAFEVAEASMGRSLLEGLGRGEIEVAQDLALLERKADLEADIAELELGLLSDRRGAPVRIETGGALDRKHAELDRVRGQLRAGRPGWQEALALEPAGLAEIRAGLLADGETQIVSFLLGAEESFVWVVGRDSIVARRLGPRRAIEARAAQAAETLATAAAPHELDQARRNTAALAGLVFDPIAPAVTARRLVLIKEGALLEVPFSALPASAALDAPYLGDRHEIVEASSASTALALRRPRSWRPASNRRVAIVADGIYQCTDDRLPATALCGSKPVGAGVGNTDRGSFGLYDLPRLPATGDEARAIAALAAERDPLLLLGPQAQAERLLTGALAEFEIVHLATHGFSEPAASGLVFSTFDTAGREIDGVVREWQVYDLRLAADLVVLSACRSGQGEPLTGEGVMSLARAFLWAGASTVVASLWDVDDDATRVLMETFYTELLRNRVSPGEALRRAQRAVRSRPRWTAPRYWAGFVVQGDWR